MSRTQAFAALILITCLLPAASRAADPKKVTLSAGDADHTNAVISFDLPGDMKAPLQLHGDDGSILPTQVHRGKAWTILPQLKAGEQRTYTIEPASPGAFAAQLVSIVKDGGAMNFTCANKPILTYQSEKTPLPKGYAPELQRGGYISPVMTPAGRLVTDDYPSNHKHHHGICFPWTKTEFEGRHPDFWNMQDKTGRVDPAGVDDSFSGLVCAGLRAKHQFIDMTAMPEKPALNETWDLIVYRPMNVGEKTVYIFDLTSTQNAIDSPLTLPKYHYGGLAVRGNGAWNGKGDAAHFLTSEGKTRSNGDEAPSRWVLLSGKVEGEDAGIAILSHPTNFRAPQPVRLHPDMPYLSFTPSYLGDWKIEKGTPYISRYRFVVTDGVMDAKDLDRLWNDYAKPVSVTLE